jgi:dimeric dUTPase (all-alpha-NTP-PPase superfamily)
MDRQITKRNHYNPCFWTALWNEQYHELFVQNRRLPKAREQKVFSLNIKSGKILNRAVNDVHFAKGLGLIKYDTSDLIALAKEHLPPNEYEQLAIDLKANQVKGYLDFENKWEFAEQHLGYPTLLEVARKGSVDNIDREQLISFIFFQKLRSPGYLNSMIEAAENIGSGKLEVFASIDNMLKDKAYISKFYSEYDGAQWHIYRVSRPTFPLPDNPIFFSPKTVMVTLSPRLLLEINMKSRDSKQQHVLHDGVPTSKLAEYKKRCIYNTDREIIFGSKPILEEWRNSLDFVTMANKLKDARGYNRLVKEGGEMKLVF